MRTSVKILTASILAATASLASAATYQWDTNSSAAGLGAAGGVTEIWSGANWDLVGTAPDDGTAVTTVHGFTVAADIALFGGTAGTVTVDQAIVPRTLQFAANGYTLATNNSLTGGVTLVFNIGTSFTARSVTVTGSNASFTGATNLQGINLTVDSLSTLGSGNITIGASNGARSGSLTINELGSAVTTGRFFFGNSGSNPSNLPTAQTLRNNSALENTLTLSSVGINNAGTGTVSIVALGGSNTGNNTVAGVIANTANTTVGFSKVDVGTWVLTQANTYGGTSTGTTPLAVGTTISAGKLITGNTSALGVGNVSVSAAGATLQVGDGTANTLTLGSAATLAFANDATLKLGAASSQITMGATGTFNIGTGVNIDITGLSLGAGDYTLVDGFAGGSTVGTWNQASDLIGGDFGLFNYDFKLVGNDAVLSVTAVPEPGALSALLGGTGVLLGLRRRRA